MKLNILIFFTLSFVTHRIFASCCNHKSNIEVFVTPPQTTTIKNVWIKLDDSQIIDADAIIGQTALK